MIKNRILIFAVSIVAFVCLSLLSSCNYVKRSSAVSILVVEDQELSVLNSVGADTYAISEFARAGLLIYNTDFRTASFIPIFYIRQLPGSETLELVTEWFETNFSLNIDYSVFLSGDSGANIYEVLESLSEPAQNQNKGISLIEDDGRDKWNAIINNAELFLQDEVFRHILSAAGGGIPEKILRNFISMYTKDEAEFYYMRKLVIDINSVNGYLYEREYIQEVYSAQRKSVKE